MKRIGGGERVDEFDMQIEGQDAGFGDFAVLLFFPMARIMAAGRTSS
jgi:hypothetical protein